MPIYEYLCQNCQTKIEVLQKISDAPLKICSQCGKAALEKCLSRTGLQFKGEGWYVTDYKSQPAKSDNTQAPSQSEKSDNKETAKGSNTTSTTTVTGGGND